MVRSLQAWYMSDCLHRLGQYFPSQVENVLFTTRGAPIGLIWLGSSHDHGCAYWGMSVHISTVRVLSCCCGYAFSRLSWHILSAFHYRHNLFVHAEPCCSMMPSLDKTHGCHNLGFYAAYSLCSLQLSKMETETTRRLWLIPWCHQGQLVL